MYKQIKVLAHLELFAGENMRQTAFGNGYRPLFDFPNSKTKISGSIELSDGDMFAPGTARNIQVTFGKGMISDEYFDKGQKFTISEGIYILGKGEILEVLSS